MPRQRMNVTRRGFLKRAAASTVAPYVVASSVLGGEETVAPSERIRLGFIGVGMMGRGHLRGFLQYPEAQVVGVCDVDRWRREDALKTAEAAGHGGCRAHNDLRELLAREDVDAVVIATGDRWHGPATVLAARAGKDVYCEKPASLTVQDGQAMVRVVERYGRVFQTGLQQRSTPEFRKACQLVQDGAIGSVKIVYVIFPGTSADVSLPVEPVPEGLDWDLWLGPAPWRPFNRRFHIYGRPPRVVPWHFCRDFGGGNLTSNTVHAFDTVQWGLGMDGTGPVEVTPPETGEVPSLTYKYANGVLLQVVNGRIDPQKHFVPEGWDPATVIKNFGALFVGEKGWIHVGRQGFLESFPAEIIERPEPLPHAWHPVNNHHQNWLECVKTREKPACDAPTGCGSTVVSHLGCIAHWTGRKLQWDPAKQVFVGDDEANRYLQRAMRPPWRL